MNHMIQDQCSNRIVDAILESIITRSNDAINKRFVTKHRRRDSLQNIEAIGHGKCWSLRHNIRFTELQTGLEVNGNRAEQPANLFLLCESQENCLFPVRIFYS